MAAGQEQVGEEATEKLITLEEARLHIGDIVNLQAQVAGATERYSVRLIGLSQNRSVLVTTPMCDGKYLLMREGQAFILRAFSGKSAFAFTTQILKSVNAPYPYLHLAYPREVRSLIVRKGARANVKLICAISSCDDVPIQEAGTLLNLSIGGALLAAKRALGHKGQKLTIKFKAVINGVEALLEVAAVIRSTSIDQSADSNTPYHLALQFVDVSAEKSIPLLAFVYHLLLEQMPGS
ncbi:MAG: flagellar brake protein [Rhodocyclaceae bacterium]|nr:flagellar brake protein [Rhodocyclaceae bacterium]